MYRQVLIQPEQRSLQCILWRFSPTDPLKTYSLNTVTYGTASAPFLAIRSLLQLGQECQSSHPLISQIIERDFYVDDLLTGTSNVAEAKYIVKTLTSILKSGCFKLRKWLSNCPEVLQGLAPADLHPQLLDLANDGLTKTLGMMWCHTQDSFVYSISELQSSVVNKRTILSDISKIFDPLGLVSPSIIIAKRIIQKLWLQKLTWDEHISSDLASVWTKYKNQLSELKELKVPRHVLCSNAINVDIHGFCDASEVAYGGCIYVVSTSPDGTISSKLLCGKARIAPLKLITIPRLELCGAHLLSKLLSNSLKAINFTPSQIYLWSDSTVVLGWLKTPPNLLKTFVANRVAQIEELTTTAQWRHVPTKDNPADVLSRGVMPRELASLSLWWYGPNFLLKEQSFWPSSISSMYPLPELKPQEHFTLTCKSETNLIFNRFSHLTRLERVVGYCLRFIRNCRRSRENRSFGPLRLSETQLTVKQLILISQSECFQAELKDLVENKCTKRSHINRLNPFIDSDGLLRVGGRLSNASFSYNKIHPILLPAKHPLTRLIVEREHLRLLHAGPQLLLASIREKFWPLSGRNLARKIVHMCIKCFRINPKPMSAAMGNLPVNRMQPSPPFTNTGVDYAGPFLIKNKSGRGSKLVKAYLCLFICFCTKAVHLELVSDLTTVCFIQALRRFVSRRGIPLHIYSDNGKTFVGAKSTLKELGSFLNQNSEAITKQSEILQINWHFIPAYSPHFGSLWEAGVKSAKHHLKRVAGNSNLTYGDMYTLLVQIEAVLNSRPLSPLSSDPSDPNPLTPAHFLIGRPSISVATLPAHTTVAAKFLDTLVQGIHLRTAAKS